MLAQRRTPIEGLADNYRATSNSDLEKFCLFFFAGYLQTSLDFFQKKLEKSTCSNNPKDVFFFSLFISVCLCVCSCLTKFFICLYYPSQEGHRAAASVDLLGNQCVAEPRQ